MSNKKTIGVIGDSNLSIDDIKWKYAFELGKLLVEKDFRIVNGGMGGVMEASTLGAKSSDKYREGMTISVSPDYDKTFGNSQADIIIPTGLGLSRNVVLVSMCDAIIAIGGGAGTLNEIALSWQMNKLIIAIDIDGWSANLKSLRLDKRRQDKIFEARNVIEAVEILQKKIKNYGDSYKGIKKARLGEENAKKIILNKFEINGSLIFLGKGVEGYVFKDDNKVYKIFDNEEPLLNQCWRLLALSEDIDKAALKYLIHFRVFFEDNLLIITYDYFESSIYEGGHESDLILLAKELKKIGWVITDFQPKNIRINNESEIPTIIDIGHSFEPYSSELFRKMCCKMYLSSLIGDRNDIKHYLTETNSSEEFLSLKELGYDSEAVKRGFNSFFKKVLTLDKRDVLNPLILRIIKARSDIKSVFDYGSGKGDISFEIKQLGLKVIAYDPDLNQFKKYENLYYKEIEFISKEALPEYINRGNKFDCVLVSLVLCHPLHDDEEIREMIIHDIMKDILTLSSHYIMIVVCNPFYTLKTNSSLQVKNLPNKYNYFKENKIQKQIKSSDNIREDFHRPISYYEKLFQEYNLKLIQIEQTIGEDLDDSSLFYSDFIIFLLEVNNHKTPI